jgi:hypothetical protein
MLTVLFIIVFVFSVQIASFHFYDDGIVIYRACHICKFLEASSGGEDALLPITADASASSSFTPENILIFPALLPLVRDTRAPPHLFLQ